MTTYALNPQIFGVHPEPPGGSRNHTIALIHSREVIQASNSLVKFPLLELAVPQDVCQPAHFLPWAAEICILANSTLFSL